MSEEKAAPVEPPIVITDKRRRVFDEEVAAAQGDDAPASDPEPLVSVLAEELSTEERQAAWDSMTEEEKQTVLAQQAKEAQTSPYSGAGNQMEGEQKKAIRTAFLIIIDLDGSSLATDNLDTSLYEIAQPPTPAMMYRACAEIMKDIQVGDTVGHMMSLMQQQAMAAMQAQRAQQMMKMPAPGR